MLLCVTGWSMMWADALSLVAGLPMWIPVVCFYAGLAFIPFALPRDPVGRRPRWVPLDPG